MVRNCLTIIIACILFAGCGGKVAQDGQSTKDQANPVETKQQEQTVSSTMPKVGFTSQIDLAKESFVLVVPPINEGDQITYLNVLAKEAVIKTKSGEEIKFDQLKNNETVRVEGYVGSQNKIIGKSIEVMTDVKKSDARNPKTFIQNLPTSLKEQLKGKLPDDFKTDFWTVSKDKITKSDSKPGVLKTILIKVGWTMFVTIDPSTEPLYEIELTGPDGFIWKGQMMEDGTLLNP